MKCKFCGCTDKRPCLIPMRYSGWHFLEGDYNDYPLITMPGEVAQFTTPCHWSALNTCSSPACIALAYVEACGMVDLMLEAA